MTLSDNRFIARDEAEDCALVCDCFGVGANRISDMVRAGCRSVAALGALTSAGTNCGACRDEIQALLERILAKSP